MVFVGFSLVCSVGTGEPVCLYLLWRCAFVLPLFDGALDGVLECDQQFHAGQALNLAPRDGIGQGIDHKTRTDAVKAFFRRLGADPIAKTDARIVEVFILLDEGQAVSTLTNMQVEVEIQI